MIVSPLTADHRDGLLNGQPPQAFLVSPGKLELILVKTAQSTGFSHPRRVFPPPPRSASQQDLSEATFGRQDNKMHTGRRAAAFEARAAKYHVNLWRDDACRSSRPRANAL